jgi:circadian clock protein KaiC
MTIRDLLPRGALAPALQSATPLGHLHQGPGESDVTATENTQLTTGIAGLDHVLRGGFPAGRLYLVQGHPGSGKTTMALQFLMEGVRNGERVLFMTMSETASEIAAVASSHGWSLAGVEVFQLPSLEDGLAKDYNTVFHPSEIELRETVQILMRQVEAVKPTRVVIDSLSEIRVLAQTELQFRREVIRLRQLLSQHDATVLMLDDGTTESSRQQLQSIAHGVVELEQLPQGYGTERRRLRVAKLRGLKFRGGYHDYKIDTGGIVVYPRLVAAEHRSVTHSGTVSTGNVELDQLLGGGLERGTSTLIMGPSGVGKSSVMLQLASAAARRGEPVSLYLFDEGIGTLRTRARALGMPLDEGNVAEHLRIYQIDPAELAPDELIYKIRDDVERNGPGTVVIDSLNGYVHAMPDERYLTVQLHELLAFLAQRQVITILVMAQHGMLGHLMTTPLDVSYVADTVILTRFFEAQGRVHKAISVVKKRSSGHEDAIRELQFGPHGVRVGRPLTDFRGVLTGVPVYAGAAGELLERRP